MQIMRCNVLWNVICFNLLHSCIVRVCWWPLWYKYMQWRFLWY